jgi:hypothetical protein
MRVPRRSAGTRSGVNWMRRKLPPRAWARVFTARVLARPGTPLYEEVPPGQEGHQHPLQEEVLAHDDPFDLLEKGL